MEEVEALRKIIVGYELLKELLQVRLFLIGHDYAYKNEYARNEVDIQRIRTQMEIEELENKIEAKHESLHITMYELQVQQKIFNE